MDLAGVIYRTELVDTHLVIRPLVCGVIAHVVGPDIDGLRMLVFLVEVGAV